MPAPPMPMKCTRPSCSAGTGALVAAPTCALLLDRETSIDVGLFDERYFIGKEDGDFTHRIRLAGYRILEVPDALVRHHSRPRGTWLFYYQIRNRWHFMLKNYQWRTLLSILPALVIHATADTGVYSSDARALYDALGLHGKVSLPQSVNWAKTKAYTTIRSTGEGVSINLAGRDVDGIVDPADFEKVRGEVMDRDRKSVV